MNRTQTAQLLTLIAAVDRRTISAADVEVWHSILAPLDYARCEAAVLDHRRHAPGVWLEPGHVWMRARTNRQGDRAGETYADGLAFCRACKAVHAPAQPCHQLLDKRAEIRAITAGAFARPALPAALTDAIDQPAPSVTDEAAAAMEAERNRQLDALEAMGATTP